MARNSFDALVLGAGAVGVSTALALQARGRSVALVDRLDAVAGETSFGNSGIVQSEAIFPYLLPHALTKVLAAALNRDPRAQIRYTSLPGVGRSLLRYFLASTEATKQATAKAMLGLVRGAIAEHRALAAASHAEGLLREGGWIKVFRSEKGEADLDAEIEEVAPYGVRAVKLDRAALKALEPSVTAPAIGGAHFPEPLTTPDPQALIASYAKLFVDRGGAIRRADATTLRADGDDWTVTTAEGAIAARDAIVALGPWAADVAASFGYRLPFFVKRGYHMHYRANGALPLRPVLDFERGYLVTPMSRGLRLTTGAEFARRDDPPSNAHLDRLEPFAREMFSLGERLDPKPWLGRRPCLPDMRPVVSSAPNHKGLWFNFAHQHLGLTLGPVTGRLVAEMIAGAPPIVDPAPLSITRFG